MTRDSRLIRLAVLTGALAAVALCPSAASAFVSFQGTSTDGSVVAFSTDKRLVPGDTNDQSDIYLVSGGALSRVASTGEGTGFDDLSPDGTKVLFETSARLVGADTDNSFDVYERSGSTVRLISQGPNGFNGSFDAFSFSDADQPPQARRIRCHCEPLMSDDGTRVFFETNESLVSTDTDGAQDVYMRDTTAGTTTLVSTGPDDNHAGIDADFLLTSTDGAHVYFQTSESLVSTDADSTPDIYEFDTGTSTGKLVSTGPNDGNGANEPLLEGISSDGTQAFFDTAEALVNTDTDSNLDAYRWTDGTPPTTTLLSVGSTGGNATTCGSPPVACQSTVRGVVDDGDPVFISTREQLESSDTDGQLDVYARSGTTTTLVTTGPGDTGTFDATLEFQNATSVDGTRALMSTFEPYVATDDIDSARDVYVRILGPTPSTQLVSTGPSGGNGAFDAITAGFSLDATHVFFRTNEVLDPADMDSNQDVYERFGTTTTLVSDGPTGGNGAFDAFYAANSADGSRFFFTTQEPLVAADKDTDSDVYERSGTTTTLISREHIPPQTTITAGPAQGSAASDPTPTFKFTSNEAGSSFKCKVDGAPFKPCVSPFTTPTLKGGQHTFRVFATDAVGNADLTPAFRTFNVRPAILLGGPGPDTIVGTARGEKACGRGGADTIKLRGGNDVLYGGNCGPRNPIVARIAAADLSAAAADGGDNLNGGRGNDFLSGGKGKDSYKGGGGNDTIKAADGVRETVACGKGRNDRATVDRKDVVSGCEHVTRT